jgi:protein-disulfide isomerase
MSKFFYALFLTAALSLAAAAQTRRPAQTPARPKPATGTAAKPAATQTPARRPTATPAPAAQRQQQQGAAASAAAKAEDCGCEAGPLPEVLAAVNGIKITPADLSPQVLQQIRVLQQEVVDARRQILDVKINSVLLEAEAKKRGVSNAKLFEDEVTLKTVQPTAADAQAYFTKNRQEIEQQAGRAVDFNEIKDQIAAYILRQRQDERSKQLADSLRAAAGVKAPAAEVRPPASAAERARVVASVGGRQITAGELEDDLRPLIAQTQEQVYRLRKNDVDQRVNDILLAQEAQKRGVTERALLEAEIVSKVPVVTEAQAQEFYNKNRERLGGADFPQVKYEIIQFMQEEEQRKLESALVARLRNAATVQTFITPPPAPAYKIAVDDQPMKGNPEASVTVVEFTDYQCPNCAAAHPVVERLVAEYGDRARFVVRDFPLTTLHADAQKAAEAAEAAREQGKYWDFTAILFRNQSQLKPAQLKQYAQVLGLDAAKFGAALDSGRLADKILRDVNDGKSVGVTGTPTFFVNGKRVNAVTSDTLYDTLKAALEDALKKQ